MKAAIHHDDDWILKSLLMGELAADFYRRLVGLGPRVAEKGPLQAGDAGQPLGQLLLQGDAVKIGSVNQTGGLLRHHLGDPGMGVSQAADRDAAQGV